MKKVLSIFLGLSLLFSTGAVTLAEESSVSNFDELWNSAENYSGDSKEGETFPVKDEVIDTDITSNDTESESYRPTDEDLENANVRTMSIDAEEYELVVKNLNLSTSMYKIKASWTLEKGATYYVECYNKYGTQVDSGETKKGSYTFKNLNPNNTYKVRVYGEKDEYQSEAVTKSITTSAEYDRVICKNTKEASKLVRKAVNSREKSLTFYIKSDKKVTSSAIDDKAFPESKWGDHIKHNMKFGCVEESDTKNGERIRQGDVKYTEYQYGFKYRTTKKQEKKLKAALKKKVKALKLKGSNKEKAEKIGRYVYKTNQKVGKDIYGTAYSALVNRKANCSGKADLYYCLCKQAGIPARIVYAAAHEGHADKHALNIVKAKKWYAVDAHTGNTKVNVKDKKFYKSRYLTNESYDKVKKYKVKKYKKFSRTYNLER